LSVVADNPGYDFLAARLDQFYYALTQVVDLRGWVHGYGSLSPQINIARGEISILERLFPPLADMPECKQALQELTRSTNAVLFQIVEDTACAFSDEVPNPWTRELLEGECKRFQNRLLTLRNGLCSGTKMNYCVRFIVRR
jgi:hypothetical protein